MDVDGSGMEKKRCLRCDSERVVEGRIGSREEVSFTTSFSLHGLRAPDRGALCLECGLLTADVDGSDGIFEKWSDQDRAIREDRSLVVACSLLKESYRKFLINDLDSVRAVFLQADEHLVKERLSRRSLHFFSKELLQSQLEAWEEPQEGIVVDASQDPAEIVKEIKKKLGLKKRNPKP